MEVEVGLRVVRGPDWQWGDQDGGEGHVGTVVEVGEVSNDNGRPVVVQWDCGQRCRYRCGVGGKYDLRVLDSAPTGLKHTNKRCHGCRDEGIAGVLWQCAKCFEYFLCAPCYMAGKHSLHHVFLRIDTTEYNIRTWVPARANSRVVEAVGIYPHAMVVRGHDWRWKNQDGGPGTVGEVIALIGQKDTVRSVVEVMWKSASKKNIYRVGHKGKVDLTLVPGGGRSAGYYYPQHLTVLGAPYESSNDTELAAGDRIKVELDPDVWRMLQDGHGGWNEQMAIFIGMTGVVMHIDDDGDLMVNFHSNAMFHINAATATKVEGPVFHIGDVVQVMEDLEEVMKLQKGHGEWNEVMQNSLGQVGQVLKVLPSGDVRLSIDGNKWVYNSGCLKHAPGEKFVEKNESGSISLIDQVRLSSLGGTMTSVVIEIAARTGNVEILRNYFTQHPGEINVKNSDDKSVLHIAIGEGLRRVVEVLLEFHPDVDIQDKDGDTPLLDCAHLNSYAIAEVLIKAGANVNLKNHIGLYPIVVAAALGHHKVLRVLVKAENTDLTIQDMDGNTALHVAVTSHRNESVAILLEAGADPTLYNHTCFSPLLKASMNGFYGGMEQFLALYPEQVNMTKLDDGHTALHIAAANNHLDVVQLLASLKTCDIDAENMVKKLTPLHLAAQRGYSRIVECLVGYGANVNTSNMDGMSILHVVITVQEMNLPTEFTPELMRIQDQLKQMFPETFIPPYITLACFLLREGADRHPSSGFGVDPVQLLPHDLVTMVERFSSTFTQENAFRGSLRRYPPETFVIGNIMKRKPDPNLQQMKPVQKPSSTSASPLPPAPTSLPHPDNTPSKDPPPRVDTSQTNTLNPPTSRTEATPQEAHVPTNQTPVASSNSAVEPPPSTSTPPLSAPDVTHKETTTQAESDSPSLVENDGVGRSSDIPLATPKLPSSPQQLGSGSESEHHMCMLCDNRANIMFKPCGHVSMCSECAQPRVKKCPLCKSPFQTKTEYIH